MKGAWIIDVTHFLDATGGIPSRLAPIAVFIGSIITESCHHITGDQHVLDVSCRRRPQRRPCRGFIHSRIDSSTGEILWHCPVCHDHGSISNWQGSPWDLRGRASVADSSVARMFTSAAAHAWETIPDEAKVHLLNNVWCGECREGTSIVLKHASVENGDLVLRGNCATCGGDVARLSRVWQRIENCCRTCGCTWLRPPYSLEFLRKWPPQVSHRPLCSQEKLCCDCLVQESEPSVYRPEKNHACSTTRSFRLPNQGLASSQ